MMRGSLSLVHRKGKGVKTVPVHEDFRRRVRNNAKGEKRFAVKKRTPAERYKKTKAKKRGNSCTR